MSTRELARSLLDQVPESKLLYVVAYLQGVTTPETMRRPMPEHWRPSTKWMTW